MAWFRDNVVDDFLRHGSDYHHTGGPKGRDAARYVVLKEGDRKPAGRWLRSGSGKVIPPGKKDR